jgi:beta-glucosidase-like glycosyl hydrolase/CubicO group peptidase (beta-lactamase class C family)
MRRLTFLIFSLLFSNAWAQENAAFYKADTSWAYEKLNAMSLEQKIGQLFMVAAYSNKGAAHQEEIKSLIRDHHIGGVIFFQGSPAKQAELTNLYQSVSNTPLFIAMDAEWGLAMRLDQAFKLPWPITVGAIRDTAWAYQYGKAIAEQCRRLGVHINFAPVVDVNTNPDNPIIGARSFGEDPERVSATAAAYIRGLQANGVMACAKHFPGHGDTDADSHKTLPTVNHPLSHLEEVELYPYRQISKNGLAAVMAAHLNVPALDPSGRPSSLSKPSLDYLRSQIGFDGLIFTDALNMRGVADRFPPGEVDLEAFKAGNDVLLFAQDVPKASQLIKKAITDGEISEAELNRRVAKILLAKKWFGASKRVYVDPISIDEDLNTESYHILNRRLFEKASTLLINHQKTLPITGLANKKIAVVTAGVEQGDVFASTLKKYTQVDHLRFTGNNEDDIVDALSAYDLVIMGIYTSNASPWKSYKISSSIQRLTERVALQNHLVIDLFANPYALRNFPAARQAQALLVSYQNHPDAESIGAQIIFGALGAQGRIPINAGTPFQEGFGLSTKAIGRMGFVLPGEVGMEASKIAEIDLLVDQAISAGATPGCQVLVARHGKVFYQKNFGHHTYNRQQLVSDNDLYDLASITKIAATVPLLMSLVERGKINLDQELGHYLSIVRGTNKEHLILRDILAHQAGLQAWIPFYNSTLDNAKNWLPQFYSTKRDFNYPNIVVEGLYSHRNIEDTIFKIILESDLRATKDYKYSDLGYYLFMKMIEEVEGRPIDELIYEQIYQPLGANTLGYEPWKVFPHERLVPTENDKLFRKKMVKGYVHDQGAALLGGVAGHAGLFSNANDLAKLMQMYLQKGHYAGRQYFDSVTVNEFIRCQFCAEDNRRGIGFDKPQLEGEGPTCGCVSGKSFGHTGFTGTLAWADPEEQIVYIFLSNRVYPDASNRKLISMSTRTKIQEVIYNAIKNEDSNTDFIGLLN